MPFIRVGLSMSLIMILGIFILFKKKKFSITTKLDLLVSGFIVYNLFSFIFFSFSGLPLSVYYTEFSNSILPIIPFYFFGKLNDKKSFYNITLYSLIACFIVGFYLQLTVPGDYMFFMSKIDGIGTNPLSYQLNYRSFLGLTATGSLSALGVLLSLGLLQKSNFKSGKIALLICFIASILSFRRASLYTSLFALLWMNFLFLFILRGSKIKFFVLEFFFLFIFFFWLLDTNPDFFASVYETFNSFFEALSSRKSSGFEGISDIQGVVFGDGLGRYGHKAVAYSDIHIPDGNYLRMFAELGIMGFSIFMLIIFMALFRGLIDIKNNYIALGVIIMVCMQAVGSDMFSFQLVAPIFWYSIGRCNRPKIVQSEG